MILLRLVMILAALVIVLSAGLYLFTRDARYLAFAWQVGRFVLFMLLLFGVLFVLERYVLTGWGAIL